MFQCCSRKNYLIALLILSLVGCGAPPASPTPLPPSPTIIPSPTLAPLPTLTNTPASAVTATLTPITYQSFADKVGVDLGGVGDRGLEFINVSLTLRPWEKIDADSCGDDEACRLVPVDENGWPTTDARTVFFDFRPFGAWWSANQTNCPLCQDGDFQIDMSGTYKLSFDGQAVLTAAEGSVEVQNQQYDPTANKTTADIVVAKGQGLLFVNLIDTYRTPTSQKNTGITNVRLIRPGFPTDTTEIFNPQFIKALQPFDTLRFMDWVGGNNIDPGYDAPDNTLDWSERNKPTSLQTNGEGTAWEYVVQVANLAKKNIWINIPIHASDDYIKGLAAFLKGNLHSDAIIYIEYSNEVWNYLFSQATYNQLAAEAEVATGNSPLNNDGATDPDVWRQRRHVKRLVEISNIFKDIFGADSINAKIRVIHSWQFVQPWQYETQLQWVKDTYGPPNQFFYAVAGAAYFNIEGIPPDTSVDQILYILLFNSDISADGRIALKKVADEFGLKIAMYEGGPDTAGPLQWERPTTLLFNCIAAHRDPRMRDLILHDMVNNWFVHPDIQGDMYIYFTLQSAFSRWGMWGLTEDINNLSTFKYQAITDLAGITKSIPPTPLNVKLTTSDGNVNLTWSASYGAEKYNLKRMKAGGEYVAIAQVNTTSYTDPGLDNPKSYFYVVTAINSQGESPDSISASASYYMPPTPTPTPEIVPLDVAKTSIIPVIDAKIDEVWKNAPTYPILKKIVGVVDNDTDLSARLSMLYDQNNLYLLFVVTDDNLVSVIAYNPWDNDSVEVYIDGGNERGASYDSNDDQLVFAYNSPTVWAQRGRNKGVQFATTTTDTGYIVEILIPWSNFKVTPSDGMIIGFDVHVNDDDNGTNREGKIALYATSDESWGNPTKFGEIKLLP